MRIITDTQTYDLPQILDVDSILWTSGNFQFLKIVRTGSPTILLPVARIQRIEL